MPVQISIRAISNAKILKGMPHSAKDEPCVWGTAEGLPNYVILRIPDADKSQVDQFLQFWKNDFTYQVVNLPGPNTQVTLTIEAEIINKLGPAKAIKAELRDFIVDEWGGTIQNHSNTHVTFNIPDTTDLQTMKNDFLELFKVVVDKRVYRFSDADVDTAIAAGGQIELTRAQAVARIIDRRNP